MQFKDKYYIFDEIVHINILRLVTLIVTEK